MTVFNVLNLVGGLVFFLFGMNVMSGSLEKMAGGKLEHLLKKVTANPFLSLILGAVITIAVQSSSATTVMLVGLVNSGIMTFSQTLYIIFGANVGTTLTSWILSLSSISGDSIFIQMLKPENFSPIFALVGIALMMMSKSDRKKSIGTVLVGFAVLMHGMTMMSESVKPLAGTDGFTNLLTKFNNPILGMLIGLIFTAIIQSSAASIGILQALSMTGGITCSMAIPIVLGQNIGTCVTSLISCIGTNVEAKRSAVVHVTINIIAVLFWLPVYELLDFIFKFPFSDTAASPLSIALIHTIFNILLITLLMPFTKLIVRFTEFLVKKPKNKNHDKSTLLDERLLQSPSVAIAECNNLTIKMAELARENVYRAMGLFDDFNEAESEKVMAVENELDGYEDKISTFLVKLSAQAMSTSDSKIVSKMLHAIGDFERLGDHAVNLRKTAQEIFDKKISFTPMAERELRVLTSAVDEILSITISSYVENDIDLAAKVEPLEQVIDGITAQIKKNHIDRLQHGHCTIEMGFILSDIITNYERVSDHCSNIAVAVIEIVHNSFDTHKYLNGVKYGNSEFNTIYEIFSNKYALN